MPVWRPDNRGRMPGVTTTADLHITSAANPRLKHVVALRRRRTREESGTTLIEGTDELALALAAGVVPRILYYSPELFVEPIEAHRLVQQARTAGAEMVQVGRVAFERMAYREGPDGILAIVAALDHDLALGAPEPSRVCTPLVLVCQGVEKPGNLGAMLRTADASGVTTVIAADPVTDWGNPNVVRASKGTVFAVPCASATTAQTIGWLAERGIALVATTPDTDTLYTDVDLSRPVALAVGAEKRGLTDDILAAATLRVRIPMVGQANSLNVAASAAIVLYEAVRQRSQARESAD